jgi:exodeoxyribonuclease VII small subunit
MTAGTTKETPKIDFESAMRDLEQLVERLEQGDLPLEESLAAFERCAKPVSRQSRTSTRRNPRKEV